MSNRFGSSSRVYVADICISEITGWFPRYPEGIGIYVMHSRFRTRNRCEGRWDGTGRGRGMTRGGEKNDTGLRSAWMTLYISPLICRHAQSRAFVPAGSTAVSQSVSHPVSQNSQSVVLGWHLGVVCVPRVCENRTRLACASSLFRSIVSGWPIKFGGNVYDCRKSGYIRKEKRQFQLIVSIITCT